MSMMQDSIDVLNGKVDRLTHVVEQMYAILDKSVRPQQSEQGQFLLNRTQAEVFLGVGHTTFGRWLSIGKVRKVTRNNKTGYLVSELEKVKKR